MTTLNVPISESQACQEGEEEEQEIENLFENIMRENFPNLAKEVDFQEIQEAQSQRSWTPGSTHQGIS